MDFDYPRLECLNSIQNWPSLCLILSNWQAYALTRHIRTQTIIMCVHISNLFVDWTCSYVYLSAIELVFVLTVLYQRSATKCNEVQRSATKCNEVQRMSVERIFEVC